jgi:hypothetical protein
MYKLLQKNCHYTDLTRAAFFDILFLQNISEVFMKRIISLVLILVMLLAFASCGKDSGTAEGIYTDGSKTYFVTVGGTIAIENGTASIVAAEVGTDAKSEKLAAPTSLDKEYFTYTTKNGGKYVSGLTDDGKAASVLIVPDDVAGIEKGVLAGGSLKAIIIAARKSGTLNVANSAFEGTTNLSVYIACTTEQVTAGDGMLTGASGIKLVISADEYTNFKSHYLFGTFSDNMSKLGA